jgi:L-threonylcarbamoyladenylate synthase
MKTLISTDINRAAELLQAGELVAIPTETVYGLAANALNPAAIEKIFVAKGRPRDNPLIVHVSDLEMARGLGLEIHELAEKLAEKFWAGSLTMVLRRKIPLLGGVARSDGVVVPPEVSCGLDTVAVRVPAHPVALELIKACKLPLAAPSANLSGSPSPTKAEHVFADLQGKIPLIIDGGDCVCGLESTVVMFDDCKIKILRPGAVTPEMLSEFAEVIIDETAVGASIARPISPGTAHKHYSPKAEVFAVEGDAAGMENEKFVIENPQAQTLYAKLREFDELGAKQVFIRLPEPVGIGLALYNRIIRAAEFKIIKAKK